MYGVSLTSGQPVTIVQKFPDLLQQVVFEVCEWVLDCIVHCYFLSTFNLRSANINDVISIEIHRDVLVGRIDSNVAQWAEQVWPGQDLLLKLF